MIYCFDLDNTLCISKGNDYENSEPIPNMIAKVNELYDAGHTILIYTARGMSTYKGDVDSVYEAFYLFTKNQIKSWGIKHHKLQLGKPSYDVFIDDKNILINDFLG